MLWGPGLHGRHFAKYLTPRRCETSKVRDIHLRMASIQSRLGTRTQLRRDLLGYMFIAPWLVGFIVFTAGPMVGLVYLAFTRYPILSAPTFNGLDNFERMVGDRFFFISLWNTAYFTFLGVPAQVIWALMLALLLNMRVYGVNVFRTLYYLPTIIPGVASVFLWMYIFNPDYGLANYILSLVGIPGQAWLWDPELSKPSLIIMELWRVGTMMVVFLAGLQGVPQTLYDAAAIDGAGRLAQFRHVTLPMITPLIFFNLVVGIISSFQIFTAAYIATQGGPVHTTLFYVLFLYRHAFENLRMGYASLLAWVLFFIILVFTMVQFRMARLWVFYEVE